MNLTVLLSLQKGSVAKGWKLKFFLASFLSIFLAFTSAMHARNKGKAYYVNAETGQNTNKGTLKKPFKDLNKISTLQLSAGDTVFLAAESTFTGSLELNNVKGADGKPIVVTTYQTVKSKASTNRATIDAKGYYCGVLIHNCSFVEVKKLRITANGGGMLLAKDKDKNMRCGVLVTADKPGIYQQIALSDLLISDIYFENPGFVRDPKEVKTANGTQSYGWGIRFINNTADAFMKDVSVKNSEVLNVSHTGIKLTGRKNGVENMELVNNKVTNVGGPGIQMSGVYKGLVCENIVNGSGSNNDSRNWARGSGLWTWGTSDVVIEKNQFLNAKGPGDSAGAHIDYNCCNIIMQYNLSANNAGGFCEILGNNHNCTYRYNVSINDGWRIKKKDGAFQEGKIFWLSGYIGKEKPYGPFNSYFYNNTIYLKNDIEAKIAVAKTSDGVCMVNNIFYIEGVSSEVQGDQYVPDMKGNSPVKNVIFENNLYLKENNWPKTVLIQDNNPIYGNPGFIKAGGLNIADYIPTNTELIINKGIEIPTIPGDSIGLMGGLKLNKDILGNNIIGKPDLGAIEITR